MPDSQAISGSERWGTVPKASLSGVACRAARRSGHRSRRPDSNGTNWNSSGPETLGIALERRVLGKAWSMRSLGVLTLFLWSCSRGDTGRADLDGGSDSSVSYEASVNRDATDDPNRDARALADRGDAILAPSGALYRIDTAADFAALTTPLPREEVKFLFRSPSGSLPGSLAGHDCVFSGRAYPFHIDFLRSLPELSRYSNAEYAAATQRRDARTYAPGSLYRFASSQHPDGSLGVMAYTFSVAADQAPATVAEWADYDARLRSCMSYPGSDLVLIGVNPEQESWLLAHREELAAAHVTVMKRSDLSANVVEVYSVGETYGYVNTIAVGEHAIDYGPRDIVIVDAADDEISLVSGLVTTFPQSSGSHLNLRLREKRLPNIRWPAVRDQARIRELEGVLVHLTVRANGEMIWERATLPDAEAFWRAQQPPISARDANLTVTAFGPFAELAHANNSAYGVKSSNLGEIYDALPAANRADGFGIPFAAYDSHITANAITAMIAALLADSEVRSNRLVRITRLEALRRVIARSPLVPGLLDRIAVQLRATFGSSADTTFMRFRSSTNVEDLEQFSGAGLYDSKTGCLADDLDGDTEGPSRCLSETHRAAMEAERTRLRTELTAHPDRTWITPLISELTEDLTEEKTVADALRKVWRSLWNVRAFDEREYYGIDHLRVYMGVAVMPSMILERSETVAFTNLPHTGGASGLYRLVTQVRDIGVVRPVIPSAAPEEITFLRVADAPTAITVVRRSTESPDADLWSGTEREEIATLLIRLHDHFAAHVYAHISPLRLDVEMDVNAAGLPIFKQARPYLGEASP